MGSQTVTVNFTNGWTGPSSNTGFQSRTGVVSLHPRLPAVQITITSTTIIVFLLGNFNGKTSVRSIALCFCLILLKSFPVISTPLREDEVCYRWEPVKVEIPK